MIYYIFLVINGKICYMGEKNKILMYDIEKKEWFLKNLKNSPYFEFYYYSSAVTLPCGDLFVSGRLYIYYINLL